MSTLRTRDIVRLLVAFALLLGSPLLLTADVVYTLEAENSSGAPISSVTIGSEFLLSVSVQDIRPSPQGVFSAYLDIEFDADLVSAMSIVHGDEFFNSRSGSLSPGIVDEAGGFSGFTETGAGKLELLTILFVAERTGVLSFVANAADLVPQHETAVYGSNVAVDDAIYGRATLQVTSVPEPSSWQLLLIAALALATRSRLASRQS